MKQQRLCTMKKIDRYKKAKIKAFNNYSNQVVQKTTQLSTNEIINKVGVQTSELAQKPESN